MVPWDCCRGPVLALVGMLVPMTALVVVLMH